MTSTLTHRRLAASPILIIVAAFVAAALVVVVLAFTAWGSGSSGGDVDLRAPRIDTRSGTGANTGAATQRYRDQLERVNTTLDGYRNVSIPSPRVGVCNLTGPC
jgi:hypothetical protein